MTSILTRSISMETFKCSEAAHEQKEKQPLTARTADRSTHIIHEILLSFQKDYVGNSGQEMGDAEYVHHSSKMFDPYFNKYKPLGFD